MIALVALLVIVFSIPSVQTAIAKRLTDNLNKKYGTSINVGKVRIKYNGKIALREVYIADHHADTLIYAQEVAASILSIKALIDGSTRLGNVDLDRARFYITRYKDEENDNLYVFTKKFETGKPATKPFYLSASGVKVNGGGFRYTNENLDVPEIIDFKNLEIDVDDLILDDVTATTHINHLNLDAERGYSIRDLEGDFGYHPDSIYIEKMLLQAPNSRIAGTIKLTTRDSAFSDFVNKVVIDLQLTEASISTTDLQPFYTGFGSDKKIALKGQMNGTLNNFKLANLDMHGLGNSKIKGDLRMRRLLDKEHDFTITGNLDQVQTNYFDLTGFLPNALGKLPKELIKLGNVNLSGRTSISPKSIYLNTKGSTGLGAISLNVRLNNTSDVRRASYVGEIKGMGFNIGQLVNVKQLGRATFSINIDGKGFTQQSLDSELNGRIGSVTYNGYTYQNITVVGNLKNPLFDGRLVIDDPHAKLEFNGLLDVTKALNNYDFTADIDYIDLARLNFLKDSVDVLKGRVVIDMTGTNLDNVTGSIKFNSASFENDNDLYNFDDFEVKSSFEGDKRTIDINSPDILSGEVSGNFKIADIKPLFRNAIGSLYTNYAPSTITTDQYMDFDLQINSKIVEVFFPKIKLEPDTFIRGIVVSNDSDFKLTFRSPRIEAFGVLAENINVRVDNKNPLFNTYIEADTIGTGSYGVSSFSLINVTLKDTLFMRSEFKGGRDNADNFDLSFYHTINADNKSVVGFRKSGIRFKGNEWFINEDDNAKNRIVFDNNFQNIDIEELVMSHGKERISLKGALRDSTYKDIKSNFENVRLSHIAPYVDSLKLNGLVNGTLDVVQKDDAYFPESQIKIDSFAVNQTFLGNLNMAIKGNGDLSNYTIDTRLVNSGFESLSAKGNIGVARENPFIDMDVQLRKLDLSAFSPLGGVVLNKLRGLASGRAKVSGSYKNPDINGELLLRDAGLSVPYLNVDYDFKGTARVALSGQEFRFMNVGLKDTRYATEGLLKGTISHELFKKWNLDLNISTSRLVVLDTEPDDFSLYYGTAFISGEATIAGPTDELVIDVAARTEKGTTFKIPLSDTESFGDNSVIYFLSPEEKKARLNGEEFVIKEIKGLELNFDMDVTRDAEVEIVVDKVNGSTLRGRGAGLLLIQINTNGKFNMYGDFTPYEGVYNFKYSGVVQKQFEVLPEGKIDWSGDPTKAILDISAVYRTQANPSILLENPSINRKIPVNVIINLDGELVQPDITFDFQFPSTTSIVTSELEYRLDDRATRELQAFSLVTQGAFFSQTGIDAQRAAYGNLIETASGIFNDILSDEDGKFSVGLDYVQGDRTPDLQTSGRFGFTVSTQISKSILINGKVGVPVGGISESTVVGDVEVDFLLNEDGTLRATVFNRQNDIQFFGQREGYTQGLGLSYSVDFNTLRDLFKKILQGRAVRIKDEEEEEGARFVPPDSEVPYEGIEN